MIQRPPGMSAFHFVVLASLRVAQLSRGCLPRVDGGGHKRAVIAQLEVATGIVTACERVAYPVVMDEPVLVPLI
jgi:DNA-directed RNA polymerase subunit K/omega